MKELLADLVEGEFKEEAKLLRQAIVKEFGAKIAQAMPNARKGSGRFWTVPLNKNAYFYISLVFPKYIAGDSRFEVIYHIARNDEYKPTENMAGFHQRRIKFPYRIHHQLFQFPNTPWWKPRVNYFYWRLLMQSKKVYYYTSEQTRYSCEVLVPYAVTKLKNEYDQALQEYKGTAKIPKDIYVE